MYLSCYSYRTSWVKFNSIKYQPQDYVIIGWQDNDLSLFGRLLVVYVTHGTVFFKISSLVTLGIDHHFYSFVLDRSTDGEDIVICLT